MLRFAFVLITPSPGVLTVYMGKPEISVAKSNGSSHPVWEASENMGCDFIALADVDIIYSPSRDVEFNCLAFMP